MKTWQIGDVKITQVVESGGIPTSGLFFFPVANPEFVKKYSWLKPHFANEDGKLFASVHAFIIESQGRRIIVDTCVGNDKNRRVKGTSLSTRTSAGRPSTRSAMMLRRISSVPPAMRRAGEYISASSKMPASGMSAVATPADWPKRSRP